MVAKSTVGFFFDASQAFAMFPQLLKHVIDFLIWVVQQQGESKQLADIHDVVFRTISEVC